MAAAHNPDFIPLSRPEYFEDVTRRLERFGQGDRAALACMTFNPEPAELAGLVDALCGAAGRGAKVSFICDAMNFLVTDNAKLGPLFFHGSITGHRLSHPFKRTFVALERLHKSGVHVRVINKPKRRFSLPIAGRSHIKFAILNDLMYLGGCNFDYPTHDDVMVRWQDAITADWLSGEADEIVRKGSVQAALGTIDLRRAVTDDTDILIDIGNRNQSIILDQALELIDQAQEYIYLTCQYFPTRSTIQHLRQAHERGVKLKIIYNNIANSHSPKILHYINFWMQKWRLPADFFTHELPKSASYIHAKLLASERSVLIGSHNYVTPGVMLGTAEVALLRHDAAFATQVRAWCDQQLLTGDGKDERAPVDTAGQVGNG